MSSSAIAATDGRRAAPSPSPVCNRVPRTAAWAVMLAAASALFAAGCEATFQPAMPLAFETSDMVPAEGVPSDIWAYPRVYYGGTYAYLVGTRWYYPTANGWMILRREPVELSRERTRIQPEMPRRYRAPSYGYPPEERYYRP